MEYARAGKPAEKGDLTDPDLLVRKYYGLEPDPSVPGQAVSFGTSGHRGSSLSSSFNEAHIVAISKAIAETRKEDGVDGPLFIGKDTHALSGCAWKSAVEVLAAAGVEVVADCRPFTPTPVVSRAIIEYNSKGGRPADGIVVTPSHNPPDFGGFKYDPPSGGPASQSVTARVAERANELLSRWRGIGKIPFEKALACGLVKKFDYRKMYVDGLGKVIDFDAIRKGSARIGVHPLSGASMGYWSAICEKYGVRISQLSSVLDPAWSFMTLDHDEKIRIDPSSAYAMEGVVEKLRREKAWERLDLVCATDPDADRFGLVTEKDGVVDPNRFLAAAALHLSRTRPWGAGKKVGKTVISSNRISMAAQKYCSGAFEVPTGFKWFVGPLSEGKVGMAGEESAGMTLLCRDGSIWTADKDGIAADLLAAEMASCEGGLSRLWSKEEEDFGPSWYKRVDSPASEELKKAVKALRPEDVSCPSIGPEPVEKISCKTEEGEEFGGIKVETEKTWFALRPSGTEAIYKIYAESFSSPGQLERALEAARGIAEGLLGA